MDQFPHDDGPKDKDQPAPRPAPHVRHERPGSRLVHASPMMPYVRLALSPVIGERHTMTVNQALALMRELALSINTVDPCPASADLVEVMALTASDYGVRDDD